MLRVRGHLSPLPSESIHTHGDGLGACFHPSRCHHCDSDSRVVNGENYTKLLATSSGDEFLRVSWCPPPQSPDPSSVVWHRSHNSLPGELFELVLCSSTTLLVTRFMFTSMFPESPLLSYSVHEAERKVYNVVFRVVAAP